MFVTINKKWIFVGLAMLFVAISILVYSTVKTSIMPKPEYTIVIDAGHGGKDGGAVGKNSGVTESYLNLQYALTLKEICEEFGYKVVLTRDDMNGLYSAFASNKKRSEMENRRKIIEQTNPDVVISIHMNSFSTSEGRGAQVFYAQGSESGEVLAQSVQDVFAKNIDYAKQKAKVGDYYILNCVDNPSILVECGFLSNPEEELLLQEEEYMQRFCYNLFCGVLAYLKFN